MKTRPGVSENRPHMDDMGAAVSFHPKGLSIVDKVTGFFFRGSCEAVSCFSEFLQHVFQHVLKSVGNK